MRITRGSGFRLLGLSTLFCIGVESAQPAENRHQLTITVLPEVLHHIDSRVFGQFMERPAFSGEIGPEAAVIPGTHQLQPKAEQLIRDMNIPVLRFPGGTDVDFMDWADMIDNLPGRTNPERPVSRGYKGDEVTNAFGVDEFLQLSERNGSEAILVVNLRDALLEKKSVEAAAAHAAGLIAYCTATVDRALPGELAKWPKLRARNGRTEPYPVRYVQIGNETWMFNPEVQTQYGAGAWAHWQRCLETYLDLIHQVNPDVKFIVDAFPWPVSEKIHQKYGDRIEGYGVHIYHPWGIPEIRKDGQVVEPTGLTAEEIWKAWAVTPKVDARGQSILMDPHFEHVRKIGARVAMTEWNWNGWWGRGIPKKKMALDSQYARGFGAASLLHAILRQGDLITLATQSMLIGQNWPITAIRVDPEQNHSAYLMPSGMVTKLYAEHIGENLHAVEISGMNFYNQPYKMSGLEPKTKVAYVDVIATSGKGTLTVHLINRRFEGGQSVHIDCGAFKLKGAEGLLTVMEGRLANQPGEGESLSAAWVETRKTVLKNGGLDLTLPPRSIVFATVSFSQKLSTSHPESE